MHIRGGGLGLKNVRELYIKTTTGHIREVLAILGLAPHWLELRHMTTRSGGGVPSYTVFIVMAAQAVENWCFIAMENKWEMNRLLSRKKQNCRYAGKETPIEYNLCSGRGKTYFSLLASLKMLMTYG